MCSAPYDAQLVPGVHRCESARFVLAAVLATALPLAHGCRRRARYVQPFAKTRHDRRRQSAGGASRAWRCCAPAAARWTRPSPPRWCWAWSSRNPRASAAAPSCWSTIPRPSRPPASTAAKWRRLRPRPACSWMPAASRAAKPEAIPGGLSVGIPGVVGMLEMAHQKYGKLPWARLFEPAIKLAENGFPVGPKLARTIRNFARGAEHARHQRAFLSCRRHAAGRRRDLQESGICRDACA